MSAFGESTCLVGEAAGWRKALKKFGKSHCFFSLKEVSYFLTTDEIENIPL